MPESKKRVPRPHATRHSRDLAIQLRKAEAGVSGAGRIAAALEVELLAAGAAPRATRHSRDLAIQLKKAEVALRKAQDLAAAAIGEGSDAAQRRSDR